MGWGDVALGVLTGGLSSAVQGVGGATGNNWSLDNQSNNTMTIDQTHPAPPQGSQPGGPTDPNAAQDAKNQAWFNTAMARIQAFAEQMMRYDPNDPLAKSLKQMAYSGAMNQSAARGLGSRGVSQNSQERAVADSQVRYQNDRYQMGAQAYNQLQGGALQAMGQSQQQSQFDKQFALQATAYNNMLQQQAYANGQQNAAALGGALGSILGPIGQSLGQSWGATAYGQGNQYPTNYYYGTGFSPGGSNPSYGGYNSRYGSAGYSGPGGAYGLSGG